MDHGTGFSRGKGDRRREVGMDRWRGATGAVLARAVVARRGLDHLQHDLAACLAELVCALRLGEWQHRGDLGAQSARCDQVGDRAQREPVGLDERR
jgi:hypothetical protein